MTLEWNFLPISYWKRKEVDLNVISSVKIGRTIKLHGRSKSVLGRITTKFAAKSRPGTRSYLEMMNATVNDQGHQSQGQGHGVHHVSYAVSCVSVSCLCPVSVVYIDLLRSLWI